MMIDTAVARMVSPSAIQRISLPSFSSTDTSALGTDRLVRQWQSRDDVWAQRTNYISLDKTSFCECAARQHTPSSLLPT